VPCELAGFCCCAIRIKDAGVAGENFDASLPLVADLDRPLGMICGDVVTEAGFGGGAIELSIDSGETESISEVERV
jgi:hypothetical protein